MKIFLDANILFSTCNLNSALSRLLDILSEEHELKTSQYALLEVERNLLKKKPESLANFEEIRSQVGICPEAKLQQKIELVEKDRPILASSIAGNCHYLLTGDRKDFGHLFGKTISGVKILPPDELAEELL